jgi:hypothetical protein
MTVPAFTVRDLTWRSYADAQPEHGDRVRVRINTLEVDAEYQHGAFGSWALSDHRRFRAVDSDSWRPEDER